MNVVRSNRSRLCFVEFWLIIIAFQQHLWDNYVIAYIALFFKEKNSRRFTATRALELLRDVSLDCSDGKQSDDDMNDVKNEVAQPALSEEESSDSDNDNASGPGAAVCPNKVNTEAEEGDDEQIFRDKDESCWQAIAPNLGVGGSLQQQN